MAIFCPKAVRFRAKMEHAILAVKDAYGMPDKFRENGSDVRSELPIIPPLASETIRDQGHAIFARCTVVYKAARAEENFEVGG